MSVTLQESLLTLKEAAKLLPGNPHYATLFRWAQKGCRGVRLESARIGGIRDTSREALARFILACSGDSSPGLSVPTAKQRQRQIAAAERELAEAGL